MTEPDDESSDRSCPNPGGWIVVGAIVVAVWRQKTGQALGLDAVVMFTLGVLCLAVGVHLRRSSSTRRSLHTTGANRAR